MALKDGFRHQSHGVWQSNSATFPCAFCGLPVTRRVSAFTGERAFCDPLCRAAWYRNGKREETDRDARTALYARTIEERPLLRRYGEWRRPAR